MIPDVEYTHSAEKVHDATIPHSTMKMPRNIMSVLVTALRNQPEAFASDLGDDQKRYL